MTDRSSTSTTSATRHPLDASGSVELAVLERSGLDESRHLGVGVVVGPGGDVRRTLGDASATIYPRSCLKPLQALAVLRQGVRLDGPEAVLATASHAGTDAHQRVVTGLLERSGHAEDDLLCPPDWPSDRTSAREATAARRLAMNCSGKHAAFLLASEHAGWDPTRYTDLDHPLQRAVRETVADLTGETIDHAGVDGCGAPVFATTLVGLARGVGHVTGAVDRGDDEHAAHLVRAVLDDAWAIDGPGRANTVTIDELGVLAKLGAEGVMVMGTTAGTAVAVKVLDGSLRAATLVALQLLADEGVVDADAVARVQERTTERVLGGGVPVGRLRPGSALAAA